MPASPPHQVNTSSSEVWLRLMDRLQTTVVHRGKDLSSRVTDTLRDVESLESGHLEVLKSILARLFIERIPLPLASERMKLATRLLASGSILELLEASEAWHALQHTARLDARVVRVLSLVAERSAAGETITLAELGSLVRMNPSHVSRLIRQETGASLKMHVRRIRIRTALVAMRGPRKRLHVIAHSVGYKQHSDFCRDFRRVMGTSPSKYLRSHSEHG